jgi:hypothetical protein
VRPSLGDERQAVEEVTSETRDRRFKDVVRARMRRTGEPYTTALAHVKGVPPPSRAIKGGATHMYPFERFSEPAKKVITLAHGEAEAAQHSYIGTEHLLLGLLRCEEGMAHQALDALGVELAAARQRIEAAVGPGTEVAVQIVPTARVKKVIEEAFEECQRLGDRHVGTHHLLLGLLLEEDGLAARVLGELGVTSSGRGRRSAGCSRRARRKRERRPGPAGGVPPRRAPPSSGSSCWGQGRWLSGRDRRPSSRTTCWRPS